MYNLLSSLRRRRGGRKESVRLWMEPMEARLLLATITVTGTGDTIANDGVVTLREAITAANTNAAPSGDTTPGDPGLDTIAFDIPGAGVRTIHLTSALPTITDPVVIDGYTQPGSSPNTLPDGDNAVLLIELNRGELIDRWTDDRSREQHGPRAGDQPARLARHDQDRGRQPDRGQLPRPRRHGHRRCGHAGDRRGHPGLVR